MARSPTPPSWRIYYPGLLTYSSEDGPPELAPKRKVQGIVLLDARHGRVIIERRDFYWWQSGTWYGGDRIGWLDYLFDPGWKLTLFGSSIEDEDYDAIVIAMQSDPDFPPKSARSRAENL